MFLELFVDRLVAAGDGERDSKAHCISARHVLVLLSDAGELTYIVDLTRRGAGCKLPARSSKSSTTRAAGPPTSAEVEDPASVAAQEQVGGLGVQT
ncbi:MAG: hypothetical protein ACR2P0_00430, partial [Acidimicrobiales bacterium]